MIPPPLSRPASFVKKHRYFEDPSQFYRRFRPKGGQSVLLESARAGGKMGRYSMIARDPFLTLEYRHGVTTLSSYGVSETLSGDPLEILRRLMRQLASDPAGGLPVTGGAVGYFGYEAKDLVEPSLCIGRPAKDRLGRDDLDLPDIYLMFFDEGLVFDHQTRSLWLFAQVPASTDVKRTAAAGQKKLERLERALAHRTQSRRGALAPAGLKRAFSNASLSGLRPLGRDSIASSISRADFVRMVKKAKAYIRQGEIFQANLSQRFTFPFSAAQGGFEFYESVKRVNPSSFFGFLDAGDFQILSGSPERLVKLEEGAIETRPIAGTRRRGKTPLEDSKLDLELILNEKERAEHIMLVDLERNDMGRVAEYGSVSVDELMVLEDYSHVKHIVSNVRGTLRKGLDAVDVFRAFFPGGTITGAPKVRCMRVIEELEPVARGPYTGSMGYLSFSGNLDLNILIRSLVLKDGLAYLQVGAGIVADSDPNKEYDETLHKAEGLFSAVFGQKAAEEFLAGHGTLSRVS